MKHTLKSLQFFALSVLVKFSLTAQTALPYFTDFDSPAAVGGWTQVRTGLTNDPGWGVFTMPSFDPAYSPQRALGHISAAALPVQDDWYVSPAFNFSGGGNIDSLRYCFSSLAWVPGNLDTIAVYLLKGSPNPLSAGRLLLREWRGANYVTDDVWKKAANLTIPATPGLSYIAFKFRFEQAELYCKFDNLALSGNAVAAPTASFAASQTVACTGKQIVFSDLSTNNPTSWSWQFPGGSPAVSTVKNPTVTYNSNGTFTASLVSTNAGGPGQAASAKVVIQTCTGLEEAGNDKQIEFFPNPVAGSLSLRNPAHADLTFRIISIEGSLLFSEKLNAGASCAIDLGAYAAGTYILETTNDSGTRAYTLLKE